MSFTGIITIWIISIMGTLLFTVIEVVTLVGWLFIANNINPIVAIVVLFVGLSLEHIVQYNVVNFRKFFDLRNFPILGTLVFTVLETVIWVVWLLLSGNLLVAGLFLFAGLIIEHTLADDVFKSRSPFWGIANIRVVVFSLIEALGGTLWLFFVLDDKIIIGVIILFIGSIIEHNLAVRLGRE